MKVSKYLIALAILFFMIASAHAVVSATAENDENPGLLFARRGQDFNIIATNIDADSNSYYYFIRLYYPNRGTWLDLNRDNAFGDLNIVITDGNMFDGNAATGPSAGTINRLLPNVVVSGTSCSGFNFNTQGMTVIDVNDDALLDV